MIRALLCFAPVAVLAAEPYASEWTPSLKSRARLIADGVGGAGVEVELAPGAITYWRDPGDAGIPPTFDFAGSENLADARIEFPAPARIPEADGGEAFGYRGGVVFPIRVTPTDRNAPVTLSLFVNYAVCEKICLPARATAHLRLPAEGATPTAPKIAEARARVPKAVDAAAGGFALTSMSAREWRLCWPAASKARGDLFVEPPSGWWLTTKAEPPSPGHECFALTLRQAPADAVFPAAVRATVVGPNESTETMVKLSPQP
jgi:DsbC/DsbD-like thiol-disulfide interchange protein